MAFPCPHCNRPVRRARSEGVLWQHGLVAMFFCSAMADYECPQCGKICQEEFPPEIQAQMTRGTYALIGVAAVLAAIATTFGALWALR